MADIFRSPIYVQPQRRPWVTAAVGVALNLLTSTLAGPPAAAPFKPVVEAYAARPLALPTAFQPPNLLTLELAAQPASFSRVTFERPSRQHLRAPDVFPNLALSTLDFQPIASAVPEFLPPVRRPIIYSETSQGVSPLFLPAVSAPFTPTPFEAPQHRRWQPLDASKGSDLLRLQARAEPFLPPPFESVQRQRTSNLDTSQSSAALYIPASDKPFVPPLFEPVWRPRTTNLDTSKSSDALYIQARADPFVPPEQLQPQHKRQVIDFQQRIPVNLFPAIADPFKPLDVQRAQRKRDVVFEHPPNLLLPLFATAVVRPFSQQDWPAPIEWRLHARYAADVCVQSNFPLAVEPTIADPSPHRTVVIYAAPRGIIIYSHPRRSVFA